MELQRRGGPAEAEYGLVTALMQRVAILRRDGHLTEDLHAELWDSLGDVGSLQTLMGFIYRAPHGYRGDYEIIDRFYTRWSSPRADLRPWDLWLQSLPSTNAVRNRSEYLLAVLRERSAGGSAFDLLNVGSGPCRDLREAFDRFPLSARVTCLDLDANAIAHARQVLGVHAEHVDFVRKNVLRFDATDAFDLAWSAGLFDYLGDRLFVAALKRLYRAVRPGGELIVGNFSRENPSRAPMEFGNWRLLYRSAEELLGLATSANLADCRCRVDAEPLGINLFLRIRKPG